MHVIVTGLFQNSITGGIYLQRMRKAVPTLKLYISMSFLNLNPLLADADQFTDAGNGEEERMRQRKTENQLHRQEHLQFEEDVQMSCKNSVL